MKLENVTAKIRPRSRWESIDLGCAMARRNYGTIMVSWMLTVLPFWVVFVILTGLFMSPGWHLFSSVMWCWVTMSIADRVPLLVISRNLFGENISSWQVTKLWWSKLWYKQFFPRIWARFSVNRGLTLPVSELEGLKGSSYRMRVNLLVRNGGDGATQASMVGLLLVILLIASSYLFLAMISELYGNADIFEQMYNDFERQGEGYTEEWRLFLIYLLAMSFFEPFFVGAGFAMYVNSRTITEGWDIELTFKRMSERINKMYVKKISKTLLVFLSLLGSFSFGVGTLEAKDPRVEKIMEGEQFTIHRTTYSEAVTGTSKKSSGGTGGSSGGSSSSKSTTPTLPVGDLFKGVSLVIFWCLVGVAIAAIVWVIINNRYALKKSARTAVKDDKPKVKSVMGMDVTPESLPLDLNEEARAAWLRGEHQLAMSLLYRGAVSWMVNRGSVPIIESDTEHDCVRRLSEGNDKAISNQSYFKGLTNQWVKLAYGRYNLADEEVMDLCDRWPFLMKKGGDV